MRRNTLVLLSVLLITGIACAHLWFELRAERSSARQLRAELAEALNGRPQPPPPPPGFTAPRSAELPASEGMAVALPPATDAVEPSPDDNPRMPVTRRELLANPEYRKASLAMLRLNIPRQYPGLLDDMALNADDADRLFDLLAEQQIEMSSFQLAAGAQGQRDLARNRVELRDQQQQQVASLLGPGRFAQWQEYQGNRPAYQQVEQLDQLLEGTGNMALSTSQTRALRQVYVQELKLSRETTQATRGAAAQGGAQPRRSPEERLALQAGNNSRLLEAAQLHLDATQFEALKTSLEQQLIVRRISEQFTRERREARAAGAAQP